MPIETLFAFIKGLFASRFVVFEMAKRDFRNMYIGSSLGVIWTFVQPMAMALILWAVFVHGFRSQSIGEIPFAIYLLTGLIPWNFFSETLVKSTNVVSEYSFIVKKIQFRTSILPIVKIMSGLFVHCIFIVILLVFLFSYKIPFSIFWLQSLYYLFAMCVLLIGYSWLFSSLNVFLKDVSQIISIAVQVGFWVTPVFWHLEMFPQEFYPYLRLNPMFYIIEGYRDSFLYGIAFWDKPVYTFYFWMGTFITLAAGLYTFKRLRSHFADVL
jgi:ABC-type polysaccharide/polyol phosphate export permease